MKNLWIVLLLTTCLFAQPTGIKPILGTQLDWGHPLTKGLVAAWFNQEAAPALGTLYDLSGNGNNGTLVGNTHSVPGKFGNALDFDGTGDYVEFGVVDAFKFAGDFSIVATFAYTGTANQIVISAARGGAGDIRWSLFHSNFAGAFVFDIDDNTTGMFVEADTAINDGTYHQVVGVRDGDNLRIYVDGREDGTPVDITGYGSLAGNTNATRIGNEADGGLDLNGQISDVKIYDRALIASEVRDLYIDSFQMFAQERLPIASAAAPAGGGQVMMIMTSGSLVVLFIAFSFWISERKTA